MKNLIIMTSKRFWPCVCQNIFWIGSLVISGCSIGSWSQDKPHLIEAEFIDLNKVPLISTKRQKCLKKKLTPQYHKDLKDLQCQQKNAQSRIKEEDIPSTSVQTGQAPNSPPALSQ